MSDFTRVELIGYDNDFFLNHLTDEEIERASQADRIPLPKTIFGLDEVEQSILITIEKEKEVKYICSRLDNGSVFISTCEFAFAGIYVLYNTGMIALLKFA